MNYFQNFYLHFRLIKVNEVDRMEETNASLWISPPTNVEMDQLNPDPSNSSEVPSESCLSSFHLEFSFISVVFRWIFLKFHMILWLFMTKMVLQKVHRSNTTVKWAEKQLTCAVRRGSRTIRYATSMYQGVKNVVVNHQNYATRYSCKPPKLFIISITLIQMMVYLIFLWWVSHRFFKNKYIYDFFFF